MRRDGQIRGIERGSLGVKQVRLEKIASPLRFLRLLVHARSLIVGLQRRCPQRHRKHK